MKGTSKDKHGQAQTNTPKSLNRRVLTPFSICLGNFNWTNSICVKNEYYVDWEGLKYTTPHVESIRRYKLKSHEHESGNVNEF